MNLAYPIAFMVVSVFLVCLPIISNPVGAITAIAITATAIPIFCFCIAFKRKPTWISSSNSIYKSWQISIFNFYLSNFNIIHFELKTQEDSPLRVKKYFWPCRKLPTISSTSSSIITHIISKSVYMITIFIFANQSLTRTCWNCKDFRAYKCFETK